MSDRPNFSDSSIVSASAHNSSKRWDLFFDVDALQREIQDRRERWASSYRRFKANFYRRMSLAVWKSSKKSIKFLVDFHLDELSSVPFVCGIIFAKSRLLSGGNYRRLCDREEVVDHTVRWNVDFQFECKLTATVATGVLDETLYRVSVRRSIPPQEAEGGKTFEKLGYADINLAEFAGGTPQSRSYLLEEYTSSARANNALLRVTICMKVKDGDFCFKVPQPSVPTYFDPLPGPEKHDSEPQIENDSHHGEHSRQSSSSDSGVVREMGSEYGSLERNSGRNSALSSALMLDREKVGTSRIDSSTRVDPESLIDELLRESNIECISGERGKGLSLSLIGKDAAVQ